MKAFRDTWRDGIHSYLTYLRDRLTLSRDLLSESGVICLQIGDENLHLVRSLLDEVFGANNFVSQITVAKTTGASSELLGGVTDYVVVFGKAKASTKFRQLHLRKQLGGAGTSGYSRLMFPDGQRMQITDAENRFGSDLPSGARVYTIDNLTSQRPPGDFPVSFEGREFRPGRGYWKTGEAGFKVLRLADRLQAAGNTLRYVRFIEDFPVFPINNLWTDTSVAGFASDKRYVVETSAKIVERCLVMFTDPGDLVLDPTCGSGTTAYVAEQWGRRWITIDTSRVALALARARIMGARYSYYLKADSREGQLKEAEVSRTEPSTAITHNSLRQGFVYERVPHITLKSIANNAEIDVIWEKYEKELSAIRGQLSVALKSKKPLEEWEIAREAGADWPEATKKLHTDFWRLRIARHKEIDGSIAAKAEFEFLYDKPYPRP